MTTGSRKGSSGRRTGVADGDVTISLRVEGTDRSKNLSFPWVALVGNQHVSTLRIAVGNTHDHMFIRVIVQGDENACTVDDQ